MRIFVFCCLCLTLAWALEAPIFPRPRIALKKGEHNRGAEGYNDEVAGYGYKKEEKKEESKENDDKSSSEFKSKSKSSSSSSSKTKSSSSSEDKDHDHDHCDCSKTTTAEPVQCTTPEPVEPVTAEPIPPRPNCTVIPNANRIPIYVANGVVAYKGEYSKERTAEAICDCDTGSRQFIQRYEKSGDDSTHSGSKVIDNAKDDKMLTMKLSTSNGCPNLCIREHNTNKFWYATAPTDSEVMIAPICTNWDDPDNPEKCYQYFTVRSGADLKLLGDDSKTYGSDCPGSADVSEDADCKKAAAISCHGCTKIEKRFTWQCYQEFEQGADK